MNDNISDKDKKDWLTFVSSSDKIPNKDFKLQRKNPIKVKSIDLHGYTLEQANKTIEEFIKNAFENSIRKLVIVTGKGIHSNNENDPYVSKELSILKYSVPEFISKNENLMSIIEDVQDANIDDGGSGAFYVYLKKNKSK